MSITKISIDLKDFESRVNESSVCKNERQSMYPRSSQPVINGNFIDPDSDELTRVKLTTVAVKCFRGIKNPKIVTHAERMIQAAWENLIPMNYRLWAFFKYNPDNIPVWIIEKMSEGYKIIFDGSIFEFRSGWVMNLTNEEEVVKVVCSMSIDEDKNLVFGVCPLNYDACDKNLSILHS